MGRWAIFWILLVTLLVLPFLLLEEQFTRLGTWLVDGQTRSITAAGVAALLALDVFLPVPSSIVSAGAGALLGFVFGTAIVWIGMTIGCVVAYVIGSQSSALAGRLVGAKSLARASAMMRRYGPFALALCRPVPVLAEASAVFAGVTRAPLRTFLSITAASNAGIAAAYAAVGAYSMQRGLFVLVFVGAIALPAIFILASRFWLDAGSEGPR